jgi:hypothetical protein
MKGDWSGRWELLPEGRNLSKSIGKLATMKVSGWDLFFGLELGCGVGLVNFWIS